MNNLSENLQNEIVHDLKLLANGKLNFDIVPRDQDDEFRGALKKACDDLNDVLGQIFASGQQVSNAATQVAGSSQSLSQGATQQASSLEEISSSLSEMGFQTNQNAENASNVNQLANQAKDTAGKGNKQMNEMVEAMSRINDSGRNILKIIKVIDEIAFQTNLLALNAAIEAARAGKHGRGFAVVAEEVRSLAARSAKAAKETTVLIEETVQNTKNGSDIAKLTEEALGDIMDVVIKVSGLVGEIANSSNDQAHGLSQINSALTLVEQVTQQNTANAEESAAASQELSAQAQQLQNMLSVFTLKKTVISEPKQRVSREKEEYQPMLA
jgi:methyl-accepting chemotaxis protein